MEGQEQAEGMVNPEKWRQFIGDLEKMGKAKAIIRQNLGKGYNMVETASAVLGVYSGDREKAWKLLRANKILGIYNKKVSDEWSRWTGSEGLVGDKIEGDLATVIYEEVVGSKPIGSVVLERTDITVHFSLSSKEDLISILDKDRQEGKVTPQTQIRHIGGLVLDITSKSGKKGMITAGLEKLSHTRDVVKHEREHVIQRVFSRCGLVDWEDEKKMNQKVRYRKAAVGAIDVKDVKDLFMSLIVMDAAGNTGSGYYDKLMVDEKAAIETEGLIIDSQSLAMFIGESYGCQMVVLEFEKYWQSLIRKGTVEQWLDSDYAGNFKNLLKDLAIDNTERLKKGMEVETRLTEFYGDKQLVKGMLEYIPLRYWLSVERMIKNYGLGKNKMGST
jgi:hypothetical protein